MIGEYVYIYLPNVIRDSKAISLVDDSRSRLLSMRSIIRGKKVMSSFLVRKF